jgi:hypothetical protein
MLPVQELRPHSLVTTTTVSRETRIETLFHPSYMPMILFGMVKNAAQRVLAAALDDLLHGLT